MLAACKKSGVKVFVCTSSTAAVLGKKGGAPADHVFTEADWTDAETATSKGFHYVTSKVLAEQLIHDEANLAAGTRVCAMNPCLILGPMLQPVMNTSSEVIADFVLGKHATIPTGFITGVDVTDTAVAHIEAALRPAAKGRFVLIGKSKAAKWSDVVAAMRESLPEDMLASIPSEEAEEGKEAPWRYNMTEKLADCSKAEKDLGLVLRDPCDSVRDLCKDPVFLGLVRAQLKEA